MITRFSLLLLPILGWSVTFHEFSERVYVNAIEKLENDAAIESAAYSKKIALSGEAVNVGLSSRKIRADDSADSGYEYSLMSEWTLKLPQFKNAQSAEWDMIRKNFMEEGNLLRQIIEIDLKHEWLRYEAASMRSAVYQEKVQVSQKGYEAGKKQQNAGRMSRMELTRLESEYLRAKEDFQKAKMEAEHIQHLLQEKGMSHEPVRIDDLSFQYIRGYDHLSSYIETSPVLESIRRKIAEVNMQIGTARQSRIESLTFGVGVTQEPTQNSLDVTLNIPIAWQDRHEHTISALMHERSSLEHRKKNMHDKLLLGIEALSEHLKEREEMIRRSEEIQKQYENLFMMAQKAFESGIVSQFEYLAAKTEYYNARLRSIELREEYLDEMYEIESRLGVVIR